jgi:hypothetical protein
MGLRDLVTERILHFFGLKVMPQELLHDTRLSIPSCSFLQSAAFFTGVKHLASSANRAISISPSGTLAGISLINNKNRKGPTIEP